MKLPEKKESRRFYGINDIADSFVYNNPKEPKYYNCRRAEFRALCAKILTLYIKIIIEDMLTTGYVLNMGNGLGRMYCKLRKLGNVKYPSYQFNKKYRKETLITTAMDSTNYKIPSIRWQKGKRVLKNVIKYNFIPLKALKRTMYKKLENKNLSHF